MSLWGEICPKCVYIYYDYFYLNPHLILQEVSINISSLLSFNKIRSSKRIGAHNHDILNVTHL